MTLSIPGTRGTAYTLLTQRDKDFAPLLVRNLEGANQPVPQELLDIAMQCPWFKMTRYRHEKGKNLNMGGMGLGFRERPGLGAAQKVSHAHTCTISRIGRYKT